MKQEQVSINEQGAGELLGIREAEVHRLRKRFLKEGTDWVLEEGLVRITDSGLRKLTAVIAKKKGVPVEVDAVERAELVVLRTCPNPHLVLCTLGELTVRCRVRDSRNFVRGMKIPEARRISETLYSFDRRLPRSRGRW